MNDSNNLFIKDSENEEDIENSIKQRLREVDEENEQYIQELYDKGVIIDYKSKNNSNFSYENNNALTSKIEKEPEKGKVSTRSNKEIIDSIKKSMKLM